MFTRKKVLLAKVLLALIGLILLPVLYACVAPQEEDKIVIIEKRQTQGDSTQKTLQANNCDNAEEMNQEMQAVNQYLHDIEITPNPGVSINRQAVEDEIRSYYRIPYGESDAVCVIPVQIPPHAFYTYNLEWTEIWREGIFELGDPDGQGEGTYRFRQSLLCEVVGQVAEDCSSQ